MTGSVSGRYALRSLRRNLRRTLLSVIGVAIGVGLGLLAIAMIRGAGTMTINAAAGGGMGHLRVAPAGWADSRDSDLRLESGPALLEQIRAHEDVAVASPRARVGGLLGLGTRAVHAMLTGVDPETEPEALRYVREVAEGRYLAPDDRGAVVLGRTLAVRLDAELGDELVVTSLDASGEMQSLLLEIVGIVETGSRDIDASIAQVALADAEQLSGREGYAEITIVLDSMHDIERMQGELGALDHGTDEVLTWGEVAPELKQNIESKSAFYDLAIMVILLVVLLGVASAQLTGVLERRKEFAVLAAIGMRGWHLVRVVVTEGVAIGVAAALLSLAWAGPIVWRLATNGIDLSGVWQSEEGLAFGGVLIDPHFYPSFGWWIAPVAFALALTATLLASLYPAWFASKTDPALALRVDR